MFKQEIAAVSFLLAFLQGVAANYFPLLLQGDSASISRRSPAHPAGRGPGSAGGLLGRQQGRSHFHVAIPVAPGSKRLPEPRHVRPLPKYKLIQAGEREPNDSCENVRALQRERHI